MGFIQFFLQFSLAESLGLDFYVLTCLVLVNLFLGYAIQLPIINAKSGIPTFFGTILLSLFTPSKWVLNPNNFGVIKKNLDSVL